MSDNTTIIVCPNCGSKNRVELDRARQNPTCGKCKNSLPLEKPVEAGDSDFDSLVTRSPVPVLVDFWAPWCGPCRMVAPVLEELSREYAGRLSVVKVNTDDNREVAQRFGIMSIPTLILFKNGEQAERLTGAVPKAHLEEVIRKHITD